MKKSARALAAFGIGAALVLSGCAVDSGESAAAGDGSITIACGNVEELCESVIGEYTKATGVNANYVRMSGGEILARLESNKGGPAEFDVWWGGPAESFAAGAERDLLARYDSPARAQIKPELKDKDGYWSGYSLNPIGLCSNKKVLQTLGVQAPQSWADAAQPALRKNVASSHPATAGTGYTFLATLVANDGGDADKAFAYLKQLHPNVLQYTKSGAAPVQMVVRGEVATGVAYMSVCERERVVNGNQDIVMTYPSEGVGYEIGATAVVAGARNEAGAHAFVDWSLSQDAFAAHKTAGYNIFPPFVAGGDNGLGQTLDQMPIDASFDPIAAGDRRAELAKRFDTEIAPAPAN